MKALHGKIKTIIVILFALILICASCKNTAVNSSNYSTPQIVDDDTSLSGKKTIWQCVYFGSFPQVEILDDEKNICVDDYAVDDGVIIDKELMKAYLNY